jgi:arylsulfatase
MATTDDTTDEAPYKDRPNILILCMDQWDTHMQVPQEVRFPAMERLEAQGVTFDRQYCTVPICTPSRAAMWTGVHAKQTGLWDNTNYAWIGELSDEFPTIGQMLREQGYYTAFKGKWHLSAVSRREDALERYGFRESSSTVLPRLRRWTGWSTAGRNSTSRGCWCVAS